MNWRIPLFAGYFVLFPHFHPAWAGDCRASLVSGIDVSASISTEEVQMQVRGVTAAIQSPDVLSVFRSQGCTRVAFFLWSDNGPVVLLPWREISSAEDAARVSAELSEAAKTATMPTGNLTNVGEALLFAEQMLGQVPPIGRQVINLVSNGESNTGPSIPEIRARLLASGVTINGVLFGPSATIEEWYQANVTGGRGSFVLRIDGSGDFARTYVQKFRMDLS